MSFQNYAESMSAKLHVGKAKAAAVAGACVLLSIAAVIAISSIASVGGGFEVAKADAADMQEEQGAAGSDGAVAEADRICIDVAGHVMQPGVIYLYEGSRVADAIAAVGGFAEDAAVSAVNQARVLVDGEQLYVPGTEEATNAVAGASEGTPAAEANDGKANINKADSSQLQMISGIGPSKADKIIAYRDANGPFASIDDLTNVSGIGEKTLESIRGSICV